MHGDHKEVRYAVKVISSQALTDKGVLMADEGEEFWVCGGEHGPSGSNFGKDMPPDVFTFKTRDEARQFASEWKGHPWWVKPKDWRIVEVVPRYVRSGWREA